MSKLFNQKGYIENGQFSGGVLVSPVTGSDFAGFNGDNPQFGDVLTSPTQSRFVAGGLYVGEVGTLDVKMVDGSVLSFTSASGFIPGMVAAVSGSSSATNIIALR
tara:strand:- start:860 stop:1174 length:315 start_codon:yes stop_codon:yes gene_type:complete